MAPVMVFAVGLVVAWARVLAPAVFVLLLVGIPGNISVIRPTGSEFFSLGDRSIVKLADLPSHVGFPRSLRPYPEAAEVTWVGCSTVRSALIPSPHLTSGEVATATLRIFPTLAGTTVLVEGRRSR